MGATMELWSAQHVAALAISGAVAAVLVWVARHHGDERLRAACRGLALIILAAYVCEHVVYAARGEWTPRVNLPLHLTDAVTLVSIAALWRPESPLLVELLYFWALAASLQAVLTPDLGHAFPDPLFLTYFATHAGAVAAACMLVFGARRIPRPGAVPRVYAATLGFTALAGIGTVLTGGNYMYLRRKPANASLLDVMGPWPVYILSAAALALLLFTALAMAARMVGSARHLHRTPPVGDTRPT
jgi:hypothetical integral membrane protein (TIGR02206 family)